MDFTAILTLCNVLILSPKKRTTEDRTEDIDQPSPSKVAKFIKTNHSHYQEEQSLSQGVVKLVKVHLRNNSTILRQFPFHTLHF